MVPSMNSGRQTTTELEYFPKLSLEKLRFSAITVACFEYLIGNAQLLEQSSSAKFPIAILSRQVWAATIRPKKKKMLPLTPTGGSSLAGPLLRA